MNFRRRIAKTLHKFGDLIYTSDKTNAIQSARVIPWFKANGDDTLRLNYPLNSGSVVFDVGGYHGEWSEQIFSKYKSNIHIFEPSKKFFHILKDKFDQNNCITLNNYGLSNRKCEILLSDSDNSSSVYLETKNKEKVILEDISWYLENNKITKIDLIKINIEGGEYDLLEKLIEIDFIKNITDLQIQFHDFVPNANRRMVHIQEALEHTHKLTYEFPFVWENWTLK